MKSAIDRTAGRKLTLKTETLKQLEPHQLRQAEGGVALTQAVGGPCELISLALSCEIIRCF